MRESLNREKRGVEELRAPISRIKIMERLLPICINASQYSSLAVL